MHINVEVNIHSTNSIDMIALFNLGSTRKCTSAWLVVS